MATGVWDGKFVKEIVVPILWRNGASVARVTWGVTEVFVPLILTSFTPADTLEISTPTPCANVTTPLLFTCRLPVDAGVTPSLRVMVR